MKVRNIPVGVAVGLVRTILPIARTWRFRHTDDPASRWVPKLEANVYYTWHENLLPLTWLLAHQGVATLASQDRDGEIVARVLSDLGYVVARGSSTRGGAVGFRELVRAARAGRALILTSDGPRGPRRRMKEGTSRLAERTNRPIVPIGLATTAGLRLRTWDRFLIPLPGATVFVSCGEPIHASPGREADFEAALENEMRRCEAVASEARVGRPPRIDRGRRDPGGAGRGAVARAGRSDLERRLRAAWKRDRPPVALRAAAALYAGAQGLRTFAYDRKLLTAHAGGLPVVSIGGVTVGGSAKTPLAGAAAGFLAEAGHAVAILTRGYADELDLHKRWLPEAQVLGHPDRVRIARRAAAQGATIAVVDDGFQHRRLRRDLEILALDRDALARTSGRLLPAGPFREPWLAAARRADIVVLTGREVWSESVAEFDHEVRAALRGARLCGFVASISFETGSPAPVNAAAKGWGAPARPRLALTGIMKPNLFFDLARTQCPSIGEEIALPDHGSIDPADRSRVFQAAAEGGLLVTYKDLARIQPLVPDDTPLWALPERLVWRAGEAGFWQRLSEVGGA